MWPATTFNDSATEAVLRQFIADGTASERQGAVSAADVAGFCQGLSDADRAWMRESPPDPAFALSASRSLVLLLRLHAVARAALRADGQREEVDTAALAELRQAVEHARAALARAKGAESERFGQQLAAAWQQLENISAALTRRPATPVRGVTSASVARGAPPASAKGELSPARRLGAPQAGKALPQPKQGRPGRKAALALVFAGLIGGVWFSNRSKPTIAELQPSEFQSVPGVARMMRYDKRAVVYMSEGWGPEDGHYAALRQGLEGLGFHEYSIFNAAGRLISTPTGELAGDPTAVGATH